ncbi:uncharacterized protein RJT21DRAFT_120875 [Scheffersomyces amazonensis]|uniref:uncharacterized protein n=1 Tax=Scheffersomyces amazonensis TaxID=1078765 RepID=UPI00315DF5F4
MEGSKENSKISLNPSVPSDEPVEKQAQVSETNYQIIQESYSYRWTSALSFSSFTTPSPPAWLYWNNNSTTEQQDSRIVDESHDDGNDHNDSAIQDSPEIPPQNQFPEPNSESRLDTETTTESPEQPWVDWSLQYRRVSSVVSYVYNRSTLNEDNGGSNHINPSETVGDSLVTRKFSTSSPTTSAPSRQLSLSKAPTINSSSPAGSIVHNQKKNSPSIPPESRVNNQSNNSDDVNHKPIIESVPTPNETTPLLNANSSISTPTTTSGWFDWFTIPTFWSKPVDEDDDEEIHNSELYKSAKSAIENSKESSHYAIKCINMDLNVQEGKGVRELELAVSDTMTEREPVRYRSKKSPLLPNEVQERTLTTRNPTPPQQPSTVTLAIDNSSSNTNDINSTTANGPQTSGISATVKEKQQQLQQSINSKMQTKANNHTITPPNQVLPSIDTNLRTITFRTKARLFIQDLFWKSSEKHIYKKKSPDVIKKRNQIKQVVVVGIHGFLPIKMVRTLIGQSTGNSVKYVNEASRCIRQWLQDGDEGNVEIHTIALEGEGKIESRVEKLMILIENWISLIESSDFIFFVSHGQGTPVAINLLSNLLDKYPHLNLSTKKIGLLSMSGVIMGPYQGLDSKLVIRAYTPFENDIIRELFDFDKPNSKVSIELGHSLQNLVQKNVKITLSGSTNDQFIPLYSSLGIKFNHPNIFRNLFILGSNNDTPTFITKFLQVLVIMKNMGSKQDYKFLYQLSEKCMGTISNGGHCKIYSNDEIYKNAIQHSLETTSLMISQDLEIVNDENRSVPVSYKSQSPPNSKSQSPAPLPLPLASNMSTSLSTSSNNSTNNGSITSNTSMNLYEMSWNLRKLIHELIKINNIGNIKLLQELKTEIKHWDIYGSQYKSWRELRPVFEVFEDLDIEEFLL